jgi:hypothetical protein
MVRCKGWRQRTPIPQRRSLPRGGSNRSVPAVVRLLPIIFFACEGNVPLLTVKRRVPVVAARGNVSGFVCWHIGEHSLPTSGTAAVDGEIAVLVMNALWPEPEATVDAGGVLCPLSSTASTAETFSTRSGVKLVVDRAEERAGPEDVGDQALMRGLVTAFPFVRPGLSLPGVGRRSCDRPRRQLGSSPCRGPALATARLMFDDAPLLSVCCYA